MWSNNWLTERLNLKWPILQAPMGGNSTPALAAAVSNAGGLGGLGMWGFSADAARRRIAGFRQLCPNSLNVNYPLWDHPGDLRGVETKMRERIQSLYDEQGLGPLPQPEGVAGGIDDEHLVMLEMAKPEVVSFHFGVPDESVMVRLKAAGIFTLSSATTVAEAKALESLGVDAIIAQGTAAGGHRGTFQGSAIHRQPGLISLLPQVVDAVDVPVIGAGGIADGRGVAAALMLGASAVQMGTAFLRCEEANVGDVHRATLAQAGDISTVVTKVISGRSARCVSNRMVETLSRPGAKPLPFPAQSDLIAPLDGARDAQLSTVLAGQSVALTREMTGSALVAVLADETSRCFELFRA